MSIEQKAKAYDEALEQAKEELRADLHESGVWALKRIFPELAESEDERIRKGIVATIEQCSDILDPKNQKQMLAWLEKQKEPSISATEVLIKAGLKPYKDGNQWCILVGDNIQEGICGFGDTIDEALYQFLMEVLGKQKEPIDPFDTKLFQDGVKEGRRLEREDMEKEQKPAEWSDDDEYLLGETVQHLEELIRIDKARHCGVNVQYYQRDIDWLKSRRPSDEEIKKAYTKGFNDAAFGGTVWKPSDEDEERLINTSISFLKDFADKGYENAIECIDWLKSKLNGKSTDAK